MNTVKSTVKSVNDESFDEVDERIVIFRDTSYNWVRDEWEHGFKLWSNVRGLRSDADAKCPLEEDDDGNLAPKNGLEVIPVHVLVHGGVRYSLSSFADPWDSVDSAMYLYIDRRGYEEWFGGDWNERNEENLRRFAQQEIDELNLDAEGMWFGWKHEKKVPFKKEYADGRTEVCHEWVEDDSICHILASNASEVVDYYECDVFAEDGVPFVGEEV